MDSLRRKIMEKLLNVKKLFFRSFFNTTYKNKNVYETLIFILIFTYFIEKCTRKKLFYGEHIFRKFEKYFLAQNFFLCIFNKIWENQNKDQNLMIFFIFIFCIDK